MHRSVCDRSGRVRPKPRRPHLPTANVIGAGASRPGAGLVADCRATTSLEFAMAGLTMVILLLAVFDVGLLFLTKRGLDYGIYRAARWAAVNSATASVSTVAAQFQLAAGAAIQQASSCQGFAAGASVPTGTQCSIVVGFPSGPTAGNPVTIQANYRWSPVSPIDGLAVITLQSSITLAIQH